MMSEVHQAITAHSQKQHALIRAFAQLDAKREAYIEEAVALCQRGEPFSVHNINEVTKQMNELAINGILPQRKYVTVDMVKEYVQKLNNKLS